MPRPPAFFPAWLCPAINRLFIDFRKILGIIILLGVLSEVHATIPKEAAALPLPAGSYTIATWNTKDGLPAGRVRHLLQDRQGVLWIATFNGVSRFDGVRFRNYDVANTPGLSNNLVNALYEDRDGTLWLGHDTGEISLYKDGQFRRLALDPEWLGSPIDQFAGSADGTVWARNRLSWLLPIHSWAAGPVLKEIGTHRVSDIASGAEGQLWLATDSGFFSVNSVAEARQAPAGIPTTPYSSTSPRFRQSEGASLGIPMRWEGPAQVFPARNGGVWVVDHECVRRWANGNWTGESINTRLRARTWTNTWKELSDGRLAVSTYDEGLQLIERSGKIRKLDASNGLLADYITSLVEDREGSLWVGAGNQGICQVRPSSIEMVGPPTGWGNWPVQAVIAGKDGSIWAGTEGAGVYRLKESTWTHFGKDSGLTNLTVKTLLEDSQGRVWAGLTNGDFGVFENDRFVPRFTNPAVGPVTAAYKSRSGEIWVGGLIGLGRINQDRLEAIQPQQGQFAQISGFAEASDGTMWIATMGYGLGCHRNGILTVYKKADGVPSDYLWSLHNGSDDTLWIGTYDLGLVAYRAGEHRKADPVRGIPGNMVAQIMEDETGAFWLGTNAGIIRVGKNELRRFSQDANTRMSPQVFDLSEGLTTRAFSGGSQAGACGTKDGILWFATDQGLARINPKTSAPAVPVPQVLIETVRVDGAEVRELGPSRNLSLTMAPGSQRLEIEYTGLSLTAPHRILFRYKLDGADESWTEAETRRTAYFSYLRPGQYVFRVQSLSAEGIGGPEASLNLTVEPFYWETAWFKTLATFTALGLFALAIYWAMRLRHRRQLARIEQIHAIERDRTRIAHDLHDEVGSGLTQLSLLTHSALAVRSEPAEVAGRLDEIRETVADMTAAIDEIVWAINPRHDSLESLVSYLSGIVQDFARKAGLQCNIDVPFDLERVVVTAEYRHALYLILKEALHNITKHAAATELSFSVRSDGNDFIFRLNDNGRGFPSTPEELGRRDPSGIGLESMRTRITKLGGTIEYTNRAEGGASISFRISLKSINHYNTP